ncbi:MAG: lantibiotic ABC transporter permease [Actinobacteria bacterium HGW-Actinobacteria-2]|nr:MAG: lantibiotic ABC transporter permease [Actinobacteria bacterium HGW-Actinobacteria-2]
MQRPAVRLTTKVLVAVTFVVMIAMNAAANALPINGRTTAAVSDSYPNLFAPAGITFSIWGVIYLLLAGYVLYQFGLFAKPSDDVAEQARRVGMQERVGVLFSVSSVVNSVWILSWHYEVIWLSTVLLATMLVLLIAIVTTIKTAAVTGRDRWFVRLPFSVYFGWLTVATIANITVWLVSIDWNGFGIADATWAAVIIAVGAVIGTTVVVRNRDVAYGLVLVWAYLGIVIKHTSVTGFDGAYPLVIGVTTVSMAVLLVAGVVALRRRPELAVS